MFRSIVNKDVPLWPEAVLGAQDQSYADTQDMLESLRFDNLRCMLLHVHAEVDHLGDASAVVDFDIPVNLFGAEGSA